MWLTSETKKKSMSEVKLFNIYFKRPVMDKA